jgi:hypothetical protein
LGVQTIADGGGHGRRFRPPVDESLDFFPRQFPFGFGRHRRTGRCGDFGKRQPEFSGGSARQVVGLFPADPVGGLNGPQHTQALFGMNPFQHGGNQTRRRRPAGGDEMLDNSGINSLWSGTWSARSGGQISASAPPRHFSRCC